MTTATEFIDERPTVALEPLVDRLIAAIFGRTESGTERLSVGKAVHEARRLRREGKLDDALLTLADSDASHGSLDHRRWLYNEWLELVRRRFGRRQIVVYTQGDGHAAALEQVAQGDLEVVAALGMKWRPGKAVSQRSLRGLKGLNGRPA